MLSHENNSTTKVRLLAKSVGLLVLLTACSITQNHERNGGGGSQFYDGTAVCRTLLVRP